MSGNLSLRQVLIYLVFSGAAAVLATPAAAQGQAMAVPPDTLVVTSEPSGATATVWVDAADGKEFTNTGIKGTTPWQVRLANNPNSRYFIEFIKDGYEPITTPVEVEAVQGPGVSQGRKTAAALIGLAGTAAGVFGKDPRIAEGANLGSQVMETDMGPSTQLKFKPNPVHAVLQVKRAATPAVNPSGAPPLTAAAAPPAGAATAPPAVTAMAPPPGTAPPAGAARPGAAQTAQAFEISCLFSSLVLDDKIVLSEIQRPVAAKFGPAGQLLVIQDEAQRLRCAQLLGELQEKGKRICFSKGLLYLGEFTFSFEEGSYIVCRRPGELVGCGITILDDEQEGKSKTVKGKARAKQGKSRSVKAETAPAEEDDE